MNCPTCGRLVRSDWPHFHTVPAAVVVTIPPVTPPPNIDLCPICGWAVGDLLGHLVLAHPDPDPLFPPEDHRVPAPWRPSPAPAKATRWGCIAALFLAVASALLVIAVLVALATLAAPRSAETTDPVDVSGTSSARLIGAPHNGPGVNGAPSPSPAVANVATSEGPSGLTTPAPAAHRG